MTDLLVSAVRAERARELLDEAARAGDPAAAELYASLADDPDPAYRFAEALMDAGRKVEARRLLDRHLAGVLSLESDIAPTDRGLYLAANYALQGRDADVPRVLAGAGLSGAAARWGAGGEPVDLAGLTMLAFAAGWS